MSKKSLICMSLLIFGYGNAVAQQAPWQPPPAQHIIVYAAEDRPVTAQPYHSPQQNDKCLEEFRVCLREPGAGASACEDHLQACLQTLEQ